VHRKESIGSLGPRLTTVWETFFRPGKTEPCVEKRPALSAKVACVAHNPSVHGPPGPGARPPGPAAKCECVAAPGSKTMPPVSRGSDERTAPQMRQSCNHVGPFCVFAFGQKGQRLGVLFRQGPFADGIRLEQMRQRSGSRRGPECASMAPVFQGSPGRLGHVPGNSGLTVQRAKKWPQQNGSPSVPTSATESNTIPEGRCVSRRPSLDSGLVVAFSSRRRKRSA